MFKNLKIGTKILFVTVGMVAVVITSQRPDIGYQHP